MNIKQNDKRLLFMMMAFFFCIGSFSLLNATAAYSLFLVAFEAQDLPSTYLYQGLVLSVLFFCFLRLSYHLPILKLLLLQLSFLLLGNLIIYLVLRVESYSLLVLLLPAWAEIVYAIAFMAAWSLANQVLTVEQGKHFCGMLVGCRQCGMMVSGLLAPLLITLFGTLSLFLFSFLLMIGAIIFLLLVAKKTALNVVQNKKLVQAPGRGLSEEENKYYILLIFLIVAAMNISFYWVEMIFYAQIDIKYINTDSRSIFISLFLSSISLFVIIFSFFITKYYFISNSIVSCLLTLPAIMLVITCGCVIALNICDNFIVIFYSALLIKFTNNILYSSIATTAINILYQSLCKVKLVKIQIISEGIIYSCSLMLSALFLIYFQEYFDLRYALMVLFAVWMLVVICFKPILLRKVN